MYRFLLALTLLALPSVATAQVAGFALRAGTAGLGGDVFVGLSDHVHARVSGTYLPYSTTYLQEDEPVDVSYEADAQLVTVAGLVDYYPFRSVLRLTTGIVYNATSISAIGAPTQAYTSGNRTFTTEQIGTVQATLSHGNEIQPYLGLGIGNPLRGGRVGLMLDMGLFYTGSPAVSMEGTGMLSPTADNAGAIQEALSPLTLYPAVSLALTVNFGAR